jgi:hypothetical protein
VSFFIGRRPTLRSDLENQALDLKRNRNLRIPARRQDGQSVPRNQARALAQPHNAVAKGQAAGVDQFKGS